MIHGPTARFRAGWAATPALAVLLILSCGGGGDGGGSGGVGTGPDAYVPDPEMPGRGVDLALGEEDDLILTAVDDENLHYSFFGVRRPDGVVERFVQLAIHQWMEGDVAEHCLTIDFDENQRPVRVWATYTGEGITLDYDTGSEADVDVTPFTWGGPLGTTTMPNPFDLSSSKPAARPQWSEGAAKSALSQKASFSGLIRACESPRMPQVLVHRSTRSTFPRTLRTASTGSTDLRGGPQGRNARSCSSKMPFTSGTL